MSALQKAKELAKKKAAEEIAKKERLQAESDANDREKKHFIETIDKVVSEFDGVKRIKIEKNLEGYPATWTLFKGKEKIMKVECSFGHWENPNYDYRVDEEGWMAKIESWPESGRTADRWGYETHWHKNKGSETEVHYPSYFEERFADFMSEFV